MGDACFVWWQLASYGFFTSRLLQMTRREVRGAHLPAVTHVDASEWDRIMVASRLLTVGVALNGWLISALRTGLMPSVFSFTVLFAGISINRLLLFLLVEVRAHDSPPIPPRLWHVLPKKRPDLSDIRLMYLACGCRPCARPSRCSAAWPA
jgi:hypothetical protein